MQDPSSSAMLPDMHDLLHAARDAAARCSAAAVAGDAKAVEEAACAADQASSMAYRMAAAVAPNWVSSRCRKHQI